jgi:hypothetical protein
MQLSPAYSLACCRGGALAGYPFFPWALYVRMAIQSSLSLGPPVLDLLR